MLRFYISVFLLFNLNVLVFSQTDTLFNSSDTILFKALRIEEKISTTPFSIAKKSIDQDLAQNTSLQEHISSIPGLFSLNANNYAQDLRISIRGFGARSPFGIRGVKIIVDGLPETTPDGQGQIDNLNLNLINDIEVIKGPAAVFYGNASGGVLNINTANTLKNTLEGELTTGSYGLLKYNLSLSKKLSKTSLLFNINALRTNGYRQHSEFMSGNIQAKISHDFNSKFNIKINTSYTDSPLANDPGGINLEMSKTSRQAARDRNILFDSGESIKQYKIGSTANYKFNPSSILNAYAYISNREFSGKLPIRNGGIIFLNRTYGGLGTTFSTKKVYSKAANSINIGYEIGLQSDDRNRINNEEGSLGSLALSQKESFNSFAAFILDKYERGKLSLNFGLRYDINKIEVNDNFQSDGDQSGMITMNALNPSLGINYKLSPRLNVFTNFRTSFETPVLSELSANPNGQGGFNSELKPQRAQNIEIGFRSDFIKNINVDLTLFQTKTFDELVSYELQMDDRTYFRNAGKTKRSGIELALNYKLNSSITFGAYLTSAQLIFEEFNVDNIELNGNNIPGVPGTYGGLVIKGKVKNWFKFQLDNSYRGSIFVNDENSLQDASAFLTHLKIQGEFPSTNKLTIHPFFAVNNLWDVLYNDNIRINAFGGRYFEPAPTRNFMFGIKFKLK